MQPSLETPLCTTDVGTADVDQLVESLPEPAISRISALLSTPLTSWVAGWVQPEFNRFDAYSYHSLAKCVVFIGRGERCCFTDQWPISCYSTEKQLPISKRWQRYVVYWTPAGRAYDQFWVAQRWQYWRNIRLNWSWALSPYAHSERAGFKIRVILGVYLGIAPEARGVLPGIYRELSKLDWQVSSLTRFLALHIAAIKIVRHLIFKTI